MKKRVYLDYAAATPIDPQVAKAMQSARPNFANPSAQYGSAREAKKLLDTARKDVAMFLGANSDEIVFTSGATESNNIALLAAARQHKSGRIISVATEHASVREPLKQLGREGYEVAHIVLDEDGEVDIQSLSKQLTKNTILVSIAYANGEIGTIQPIVKIGQMIREYEKAHDIKIVFHSDASAAALLLNCEVSRLGVDLLTLSGNKLYGPAGVGALYVRRGTQLAPILFGGGQEMGIRPGTESVELAVGLAKSLQLAAEHRDIDSKNFTNMISVFDDLLKKQGSTITIGATKHGKHLSNVIAYTFEGINGEDIVAYMDAAGFEIATGAACEAAHEDPSPSLLGLGISKAQAQGTIRVSVGRGTTQVEVDLAAQALINTLDILGYKWDN